MKRFLLQLVSRIRTQRRRAAMTARLESLNDRLLADIGLTRDRISAAGARTPSVPRWRDLR